MLIYLASPIDAHDPVASAQWRQDCRNMVEEAGLGLYDPASAFHRADLDAAAAYRINEDALRGCDGLLAHLPKGVASVGVPMGVQTAVRENRPVVCVGEAAETSMQLAGMGIEVHRDLRLAIDRLQSKIYDRQIGGSGIRWTGEDRHAPRRGYSGDAGFDLVVSEPQTVWPGQFVDVPCGIRMELPEGVWAMITGRSSTLRKRGLLVSQGIIDQGYRGPLFTGVWNLGREKVEVKEGERIAQLIPFARESHRLGLVRVDELNPSDRGEAGFGSTGA